MNLSAALQSVFIQLRRRGDYSRSDLDILYLLLVLDRCRH
jgi:hypothetical protein